MQIIEKSITEITPYEKNPRKNDEAVELVDRDDLTDEINRVTFAERYDYNVAYDIVTSAETVIEMEE